MTTLNIVAASDIHEERYEDDDESEAFPKYQHIRDLVRSERADALILHGDYFDEQQEVMPVLRVRQQGVARLNRWVDSADQGLIELYGAIMQFGGMEGIRRTLDDPGSDPGMRKELEAIVKMTAGRGPEIEAVARKYKGLVEFSQRWTDADIVDLKKELAEENVYRFRRLDQILGQAGCPVYAVRGNWETDAVLEYKWQNLKFLEKSGVVDIKGVKIAGVPNWYEAPAPLATSGFYKNREQDPAFGGNRGGLDQEFEHLLFKNGTEQEKMGWTMARQIPTRFLAKNPVWNRLKDEPKIDVIVTHKGPDELATEGEGQAMKNYGSGIGLAVAIATKKPSVVIAGHIHGKSKVVHQPISEDHAYQGVRTSNEEFFGMTIDTDSKRIVKMDKFRWPKEVVYKKAA